MAPDTVHTFSYSRLSTFSECPRRYHFKYIEKTPEAFLGVEAFLGQTIHKTLAWLYEERKAGTVPDEKAVVAHFADAWDRGLTPRVRVIRKGDTLEARYDAGRKLLQRYYRGPLLRDKLRTLALEENHVVDLPNGHRYRGIFDRLAVDDQGRHHIIDYKTGKRVPLSLDEKLAFQLRSYAFLYLALSEATEVRLWYHYLVESKTMGERVNEVAAARIRGILVDRIDEALAASEYPARPSGLCPWCGYRDICDASGYGPGGDEGKCPLCGKRLREKSGRYGPFLSCEGYPRCRYSRNVK